VVLFGGNWWALLCKTPTYSAWFRYSNHVGKWFSTLLNGVYMFDVFVVLFTAIVLYGGIALMAYGLYQAIKQS
jgi:hypothetical protein